MKLKDNKNCCKSHLPGHIPDDAESVKKLCRSGYCVDCYCPTCGLWMYGWGPIACPHKKNENGTLRWYKFPDMDVKHHVAAKGSVMRKRSHGGKCRVPRRWADKEF